MADKIATINDIDSHIYQPDSVGRNRCVTPELLYYNVLQGETYNINGSYSNNQLVPLSKISFGEDKGFTVVIGVVKSSSIIVPTYVTMDFNKEGYGYTYNSEADKSHLIRSDRVLDDYAISQDFDGHINITLPKVKSTSDAVRFWLEIQADDGWNLIDHNSDIDISSGESEFNISEYATNPEEPTGTPVQILFSQSTQTQIKGVVSVIANLSSWNARAQFQITITSVEV